MPGRDRQLASIVRRATPQSIGLLILGLLAVGRLALAADDAPEPIGLQSRVAWTTSRLFGSPEPPLPYTVERTFTALPLSSPIYLADEPGSDRLWIIARAEGAEKNFQIVRIANDPAVTVGEVLYEVADRLVYSVAFDPDFATNRQAYVFSNGPTSQTVREDRITRFTLTADAPSRFDPESELVVLAWKSAGHDGGDLAFGPDRMLYITTGDGTGDSDTDNTGQTLDDLLGSVLRIDVSRRDGDRHYAIPADNPFATTPGALGEIWAYGLRNPWRMSFDARTGHLWVGNNGQDLWETAHLVRRGDNLGWSVFEGNHPFYLERKRGPTPIVPATIEHSHADFRSLTGGVVYYGDKLPDLAGAYIYGDYSSGRIWGMKHDGQQGVWHRELADTALQIAAFRVDQRGELLIVDHTGGIYRLVVAKHEQQTQPFPPRLSETGLFANTAEQKPAPGVIPYSVNVAGWADGAVSERWLAVPGDQKVTYDAGKSWNLPDGAALVQTLSRPDSKVAAAQRIETRVLLRQQGEWAGYTYRWNIEQTDAELVARIGADVEFAADGVASQAVHSWRIPSRSECMTCHSRAASFVLGLSEAQLNRYHDYDGVVANQLATLSHIGLFTAELPKPPGDCAKLSDPADASADVEARVRSYLQVNCAVCHVSAGGGNAQMELGLATPRDDMKLVGARPQHDTFGIRDAMLIAPGDADRSVLLHRLSRRGRGQMPPLVTRQVDEVAVALLRQWVGSLKPAKHFVRNWTVAELEAELPKLVTGRSYEKGQLAFRETGCAQCHKFAGQGGTVGPDLSTIARRLVGRELLESIVVPSKIIADEYASYALETADGKVITGRIEREANGLVVVRPASAVELPIELRADDIVERTRLSVSNMPEGVLNVLQQDEVLDLLAYLLGTSQPMEEAAR